MRCIACNKVLSDFEATRKHEVTKEYLDLCNLCLRVIYEIQPIPYINNSTNRRFDPIEDEDEYVKHNEESSLPTM